MSTPKIFESEFRFCQILWNHEPIGSTALVKLCKEELGWSKATTYTVIRRLSERGVVKNENATVESLVSREEAQCAEIDALVEPPSAAASPLLLPPSPVTPSSARRIYPDASVSCAGRTDLRSRS